VKLKADCGIDSPGMVEAEIVLGMGIIGASFLFPALLYGYLRWLEYIAGIGLLLMAGSMLLYSKSGKLAIRDRILKSIPWRGDERVLDVGCGRGLLLIGAAKCVLGGHATGVDVWDRGAITGNSASAVRENAALEGVASRIDVVEGDARRLPFPDAAFDVVLSNFVVHEVDTPQDREQMMSEMMRVLRPGGRLALVDFIFTGQSVEILRRLGMRDACRIRVGGLSSLLGRILMFGTFQIHLVTGSKAATVN
jgi:SAM-dependent methyltransferase